MPTGQATKKSEQVTYFYLQNATDVIPAMDALLSINHNSHLHAEKVDNVNSWRLEVVDNRPGTDPQRKTKHASLGDVLVWDAVEVQVMRLETFQTKYSVP